MMKNKIVGFLVGMLFIVPAIALDVGARTTAPASSSEVKAAFIFGRYTNLTADNGYLTIEAVNVWVIYKEPRSFAHFPRGTQVTFDMYSAYGHMFKKINVLFLHVELVV